MSAPVYVERDGAIATVVLDRAERMNALDKAMWMRLGALMRELDADQSLRCIVLRGAVGIEGRIWGARAAYDKGLVSRVVPDPALAEEGYASARRIADGAPPERRGAGRELRLFRHRGLPRRGAGLPRQGVAAFHGPPRRVHLPKKIKH